MKSIMPLIVHDCGYDNVAVEAHELLGTLYILKTDGTVFTPHGWNQLRSWSAVKAFCISGGRAVGLRADGTVCGMLLSVDNCRAPSGTEFSVDWRDVVSVLVWGDTLYGVARDGRMLQQDLPRPAGADGAAPSVEQLPARVLHADDRYRALPDPEQSRKARGREQLLRDEEAALRHELGGLQGLFSGKRRREIVARLEQIKRALDQL